VFTSLTNAVIDAAAAAVISCYDNPGSY